VGVDAEYRKLVTVPAPSLSVERIAVMQDNYVWLLHDPASGETVVIDPGVAAPVLARAEALGWRISQIWNTHWHADHTGGNAEIKAATGCTITGPDENGRIPTLDRVIAEGDRVRIGSHAAAVIAVPGHTSGHIAFHLPEDGLAFVGDTLFAMGCGRLFEGTASDMFGALARLNALPPETIVYPAHEYTQSNGRYALVAEPDNMAIRARMRDVDAARAAGEATLPTTIALEQATNPFLRAADAAELGKRRAEKDAFRG